MADITGVEILRFNDLSLTNIKGKVLDPQAFKGMLTGQSRVLITDYGTKVMVGVIGLCDNFNISGGSENRKITADVTFYDVNGFDTGMPPFITNGLATGAFVLRPLIHVIEVVSGVITKANILNVGVQFTL